MTYRLQLKIRHRPEVLERVLRVTRHRGFSVTAMTFSLEDGENAILELLVVSGRAIELLCNQLNKLIDVIHCEEASANIE